MDAAFAATELFAREGAAVGIVDLPQQPGAAVAARLREDGLKVAFAPADVSDELQVKQAVDAISGELGPITVLFNHAGTIIIRPFLETSVEDWDLADGHQCPQHVPDDACRPAAHDQWRVAGPSSARHRSRRSPRHRWKFSTISSPLFSVLPTLAITGLGIPVVGGSV